MKLVGTEAASETTKVFGGNLVANRLQHLGDLKRLDRQQDDVGSVSRGAVVGGGGNAQAAWRGPRARSGWRVVATTRDGAASFFSRKARSTMPPIFPAPSTARRLCPNG